MASRTESPEFETVRGRFADISKCISEPDVVTFAGELLQFNLISDAGHQDAIAVTGSSPSNKVARLVLEAMKNVSNSPDNFNKFVSVLESRNAQLSETLKSDYSEQQAFLPPEPKRQKEDPSMKFVADIRQVYRTAQTPTWDPLPQCQHVKLAMIDEKGKRCGSDKTMAEGRVEGDVDKLLTIKVPVDSDKIFDAGTFDDERQVILVEGVGGMGKTNLAYQYAKKWAEGKLSAFDAVALVRLRDLNEHNIHEIDRILPHLLFLASGNSISKEVARLIINKQKILLILDGWDEAPASIRKPSFIKDLLRSVSLQTRILITSRPDFSLDLHSLANRVEILGFTKSDIHDYFENALKSHLPNSEVTSACDKLNSHFRQYPVIESCCYVPLNAAILAYIYLNRDQSLPVTRCELFQELILCCIVRELNTRQPDRVIEDVSSFEDLPADLKEQLHKLSELAFNGVMQNKIVFTQKELALSTLGLLHSVQGFGSIGRKFVTCNFIHLSVQELLAAYHITRLESAEHSALFKTLLAEKLNFSVLQFYTGLTRLTNESVRNLITEFDYQNNQSRQLCLLAFLNCIYEAQISDQGFFEKMVSKLRYTLQLSYHILSPMDCISLHYFLSSIRVIARGKMTLMLDACRFDDYSWGLLLGETPISSSGIMDSVKTLSAINSFSDTGFHRLVKALYHPNSANLETLFVGSGNLTDMGLVPLLEALPRQYSLRNLRLSWSSSCPEISLKRIGEFVGKTTLNDLHLYPDCSPCEQEKPNLIQSVVTGVNSLVHFFHHSCIKSVNIVVTSRYTMPSKEQRSPFLQIQKAVKLVNAERETKLTVHFQFYPFILI